MATDHSDRNELFLLATYIEQSDKWLRKTLERLEWTENGLENRKESPHLVLCTHNSNHFVSPYSAEPHALRCQRASKGIHLDSDSEELILSSDHFYKGTYVKSMKISPAVENAVREYASSQLQIRDQGCKDHDVWTQRDFIQKSQVIVETHESQNFSSLEDSQPSSPEVYVDPLRTIRFIKSWKLVPSDCTQLVLSSLTSGDLKGWLFKNLPKDHSYSSSLGGELQSVETIAHFLVPPPPPPPHADARAADTVATTTTPNKLMEQLVPLLGSGARSFVLSLWKHIYINRVQVQHDITDSTVEDLLPSPLALPEKSTPSVLENIQAVLDKNPTWPHTSAISLPMEYVFYNMTPAQRLAMYEYVAAVTGSQMSGDDPDLVRDDNMSRPNKEDEGAQKSYLEVLQEQRDYRRRRQSYRAKNVHITKRTPLQVMRDIIESRMEDIRISLEAETPSETVTPQENIPVRGDEVARHPGGQEGHPGGQVRSRHGSSSSCHPSREEREPSGRYLSSDGVKRSSEAGRRHSRDRRRSRSRSRDRRHGSPGFSSSRERRPSMLRSRPRSQERQPQSLPGQQGAQLQGPPLQGSPKGTAELVGLPPGVGAPQTGSEMTQAGSQRSRSKSRDGRHKSYRSKSREGHHHHHHHHHHKNKSPSRRHLRDDDRKKK